VRRILRDAAMGELGTNLNEAADETLIAAGLEAGDGTIVGTTSEWETPEAGDSQWQKPETGEVEVTVAREHDEQDTRILEPVPADDEIRITATNWLEEVEVEDDAGTIEWPAGGSDVENRERIDTPRVRHLFPVPEDAEWEVRELKYDHYRHAG